MMKVFGLASIALLAMGAEASARCSVPRAHLLHGQTIDRPMTASAGQPCGIRLRSSAGPTFGADIVERPKHGTAVVQGPHRIVYTAQAGYLGEDSFTYARKGVDTRNASVTMTARVAVRVVR
jgi:Bacterial Ig domain